MPHQNVIASQHSPLYKVCFSRQSSLRYIIQSSTIAYIISLVSSNLFSQSPTQQSRCFVSTGLAGAGPGARRLGQRGRLRISLVLGGLRRWPRRSGPPLRCLPGELPLDLVTRAPRYLAARRPAQRRQALHVRAVRPALPLPLGLRQAPRAEPPSPVARRQTLHLRRLRHAVQVLWIFFSRVWWM